METYNLTKEQAEEIKQWRIAEDCSWRKVASLFSSKYPEIESPTENQLVGRDLCASAMIALGEEEAEGWN